MEKLEKEISIKFLWFEIELGFSFEFFNWKTIRKGSLEYLVSEALQLSKTMKSGETTDYSSRHVDQVKGGYEYFTQKLRDLFEIKKVKGQDVILGKGENAITKDGEWVYQCTRK